MEKMINSIIDWGVATTPLAGEKQSGDTYVVKSSAKTILAAVIDGLGHGENAASVARIAAEELMNHDIEVVDAISLITKCHDALLKTRGVVLSLALLDHRLHIMTWLGVGNVSGLLLSPDSSSESLLLRAGVVGYLLPPLHQSSVDVKKGDILIFFTDGISSGFEKEINLEASPRQIADSIMMNYNKKTDDALVLVVRYLGS